MSRKTILPFLESLMLNNEREWVQNNQIQKNLATQEFLRIIENLQENIMIFEPNFANFPASKLMFRLNRDLRFSRDKTPYNPTFRAHIGPNGKVFLPTGYYIQIAPFSENTFLAGGFYSLKTNEEVNEIRSFILENQREFLNIIHDKRFTKYFTLKGEKLKRFPRNFEETSTEIDEYLKHKNWYVEFHFNFSDFKNNDEFVEFCTKIFQIIKPLNDFLNRSLINFKSKESI